MMRLAFAAFLLLAVPVASAATAPADVEPDFQLCPHATVNQIVTCVQNAVNATFALIRCVLAAPPGGYPGNVLACFVTLS